MTQYVASTAKAIGIGVGSLSVIAYLALWGGQRQVLARNRCFSGYLSEIACFECLFVPDVLSALWFLCILTRSIFSALVLVLTYMG